MHATKTVLRTAGAVGIVLASLTVGAQELKKGSAIVETINVMEAPSLPAATGHKLAPATGLFKAAGPASGILDMGKLEMVTERYADGKIKVEREVGQDAAGNYCQSRARTSSTPPPAKSSRRANSSTASSRGSGPSSSPRTKATSSPQARTNSGRDRSPPRPRSRTAASTALGPSRTATARSIIQWNFDNGTRSGTWTWWHSNGQKRLEATYVNGALNGDVMEWDRDGKTLNQNTYIDGKCVVKTIGWYTLGQKHFEGTYLRTPNMPQATYDWWNSQDRHLGQRPAGPDQQHGLWTEWYPSGNKMTEGQYDRGIRRGQDHLVVRERPGTGRRRVRSRPEDRNLDHLASPTG